MKRARAKPKRRCAQATDEPCAQWRQCPVCAPHQFLALPLELWQRVIWPLCGPGRALAAASVCRAWKEHAYASVQCFSLGTLPYSRRLMRSLVKSYLAQFTRLTAFYVDQRFMRMSSAMPALASLQQLRTLALENNVIVYEPQIAAMTQITALDISCCYQFYQAAHALRQLTQLVLLDAGRSDYALRLHLPALTQLTFLDLNHASGGRIADETLRPLTRLQHLDLSECALESYTGLSALRSLAFLNLDGSRVPSLDARQLSALVGLSALTWLSIDCVPVPAEIVLALAPQLRTLCIGESETYALCDSQNARSFGSESLTPDVRLALRHARLVYRPVVLGSSERARLVALGLALYDDGRELNAFKAWLHPLPPDYFNVNQYAESLFINDV